MKSVTTVRRFQYWDPVESECLDCTHEKENPCNYFAINTF